jgi:hypothetical protein
MPVTYRPMREADLLAVHEVNLRAFEDLDRRRGTPYPGAAPDPAVAALRDFLVEPSPVAKAARRKQK